jgi:glycosyltransferase involved in cell wall biosynthesis
MSCRLRLNPLKIALLSRWYWLENHYHQTEEGGASRQLAEAVAALGHEVVVLTQCPGIRKLKEMPIGSLETWASPRDKHHNFFTSLRDTWVKKTYSHPKIHSDALFLREFLAQRGPFDVIWAHSASPDGVVAAMAARMGVKLPPLLVQIQGLPRRVEKGVPVFVEKRSIDLAFRQASRILADSEMIAAAVPRYAGPGHSVEDLQAKVRVVYPNLQSAFFQVAKEGPTAPMQDRVLFLGDLTPPKGAFVFLRAIPKTEASKRNSTFVVIGDFVEYNRRLFLRWEEAQEAARVKLHGARVEYLGRVSAFEVIRQIKLARVVVIPSLFDSFSRGLVEALILGRPVITTDQVGSSPLVTEHQCGIVVAPNDSDALAQAIDAVLSPIVPFADNAQQIGESLGQEFLPETIAAKVAYHLSRIIAPEK